MSSRRCRGGYVPTGCRMPLSPLELGGIVDRAAGVAFLCWFCAGCGVLDQSAESPWTCEKTSDAAGDAMALVPEGEFWMGCNASVDGMCWEDEYPYHRVYVDSFLIDVNEVTVRQFRDCFCAGECPGRSHDETYESTFCNWYVAGKDDHPMNCVDPEQAARYCEWAGKRLCTEAEWEKAARGGCEKYAGTDCAKAMPIYPWGDSPPDCTRAILFDGSTWCGVEGTSPVGTRLAGASVYGVLDMAGSVGEFVADVYSPNYYCMGDGGQVELGGAVPLQYCGPSAAPFRQPWDNPRGPQVGVAGIETKGIRGGTGGAVDDARYIRASKRGSEGPWSMDPEWNGIRCCRSVD